MISPQKRGHRIQTGLQKKGIAIMVLHALEVKRHTTLRYSIQPMFGEDTMLGH
jgi:hypothetical protein